ncbi:MAG: DUF4783 domain-containing protein [bacterium]
MRPNKLVIVFFPFVFVCFALAVASVSAQIPKGINESFTKGNSRNLSVHFNENIELVVLNNEDVYSKSQAELILRNFFSENKPVKFELLHQGGKEASRYAIGNLQTEKGNFRIYFLLKLKDSVQLIHLLRIERVEEAVLIQDLMNDLLQGSYNN